ncbi:MAG TPA: lysophospholipid acyltransferase family protein [Acidimicrobiia bacterium]|nr:lysophospholipid acyltransferase family protein [Acidimicrobiia bacterium]
MEKLMNWAVTVPFLVAFGLVLVVYDIVGRIVRPFSLTAFEWVMGALQATLVWVYRIFGTRLTVERSPRVKPHTGYIIISNHQSLYDIVLIGGLMFSNLPKYVAKAELGRWIPSVSLNLKRGEHALIDRGDAAQALDEIRGLGERVQARNRSAVIFPEGTRSRDGSLGPFKRAGARALLSAADRLPVVPVAVQGSWRLNKLWPFHPGSKVRIAIGDPLERHPDDAAEVLKRAREWIAARVDEGIE